MRGRQVFMDSLVQHGADAIFANPGTTENPVLDSLLDYPNINYYVALHEGIAVGAAGYYARTSGKTAIANLHVAPGLGNAIGMLYGVLRASSPVIVTAGQQDTRMRLREPILYHDLISIADPVTKWAVEPQSADEIGPTMRRAFKVANEHPKGPVFVALPINVMEQETNIAAEKTGRIYSENLADTDGVENLAKLILASKSPAIIAGDDVANNGASSALQELAELTGSAVFTEYLRTRQPISNRPPNCRGRIPYEFSLVRNSLSDYDFIFMMGGQFIEEVWYDKTSPFPEGAIVTQLEAASSRLARNFCLDMGLVGDIRTTLKTLVAKIQEKATPTNINQIAKRNEGLKALKKEEKDKYLAQIRKQKGRSPMSAGEALELVGQTLPEQTISIDETITASTDLNEVLEYTDSNFFSGRGGGIGQCLAGAIGVAVAKPNNLIAAFSGDGSAMYSIQALWTAAHHKLNILFVIVSNREYRVLKHNIEAYRIRFDALAERPYPHMDLTNPELGFVEIACGMGVPGALAKCPEDIAPAIDKAIKTPGPFLLEILVAGKE